MGAAHDYSVIANTLTSNGPTAMSDDLGVFPGAAIAGDTAPIVLGATHLGDTQAGAATTDFNHAYGDAVVRTSTGPLPADLAGASLGPGVYNASGAVGFTAAGVLTLDGGGDPNAVFILQVGAALTVGAGAQVKLVGKADACNVFWAVGAATSVGANAKLAGTLLGGGGAVTVGAGSRVDGRVLGVGSVTLSGNAIRTACSKTIVVAGPAGPAGADGADGTDGTDGARGSQGDAGAKGDTGPRGATGATGLDGLVGESGAIGATGLGGAQGIQGTAGVAGIGGPQGAAGVAGLDGLQGAQGATGASGLNGLQGLTGAAGTAGATGAAGLNGLQGLTGAAGATGTTGINGLQGLTGAGGVTGATGLPGAAPAAAKVATLCVTHRAAKTTVRRGARAAWRIGVTNCGTTAASRVVVTNWHRRAMKIENRAGGTVARGALKWRAGTLAPGASATYSISTRPGRSAALGSYVSHVTADGDNTVPAIASDAIRVMPRRR